MTALKKLAWATLPNASHIDAVLAQLRTLTPAQRERAAARGAAWDAAWDAAWGATRDAAWDAAWDAARGAAWVAAWVAARDAARDATGDVAWGAAWDAIAALIGWDHAATFYTMPLSALRFAARAGLPEPDNHIVTLLLAWREIVEGDTP